MNENDLQPGMLMETPKSVADEIEMYDVVFGDLGEERLATEELMELAGKPYKWCCGQPHCRHFIRFTLDQLDAIPFLIVRHLEKIHGMTRSEIEAAQPALKNEIVHERWLESEPMPDSLQQASDNEKQTTRRKTKMGNNKPIKKVQVGQVSVAVWENEINGDKGERIVERVTVDKRYKDATGWKSTGSFNVSEIPKLILALEKAYEFLVCKSKENGDGEEVASDDHE